ncbi:MAG: 3-deoxy-7-phosphoheptulonate synthase class II [Phycisphaerales bacterium]
MPNPTPTPPSPAGWSPASWKSRPAGAVIGYATGAADPAAAARVADDAAATLRALPPLVTSWEIEKLKRLIAEAQEGKRFLLQGGDCAETIADCTPARITNKLKILLQMSLVLIHAGKLPVIRVGRFAGQYAKPRSSTTETRRDATGRDVTLPSYCGELYNSAAFTPEARRLDPALMVRGYQHAAMTLNFIRALVDGGFADLHHPEYWDLSFLRNAGLAPSLKAEYERMTANLADGLRFMEALGEARVEELTRVDFYTSHEGFNLLYESAQTRTVPRRDGHYDLTTHMPWIGDRTRAADGAHAEFFRGVRNPIGVKLGPGATPADVLRLIDTLNPADEPGRITLITRLGAERVRAVLAPLVRGVRGAGRRVLWSCDPMHGNGVVTASGVKTRSFDAILKELEETFEMHESLGSRLGGVHFELTGEDVTECMGGAAGVTEAQLSTNYASVCDPRLNYQQALEMAFLLARRLAQTSGRNGGVPRAS